MQTLSDPMTLLAFGWPIAVAIVALLLLVKCIDLLTQEIERHDQQRRQARLDRRLAVRR